MHVIIWRFRPRPGYEAAFRRAYGPGGDWERLFEQAPGFLGTDCLENTDASGTYLTIDRWTSADAYWRFREQWADAYATLDRYCATITEDEAPLGSFERCT